MVTDLSPSKTHPLLAAVQNMTLENDAAKLKELLIQSSYSADMLIISAILDKGIPIGTVEEATGMTALHYAVGRNNMLLTMLLVERGAPFAPDKYGRWPSTIALMCEADEDLCDYIIEAEAAASDGTETEIED